MREIHLSKRRKSQPNFDAGIDVQVSNWSYDNVAPGRKFVISWEDAEHELHVSSTPYLSGILKICSGATSVI